MSQTAFERYAPFIREYIYRKQWTYLHEVQVESCEAILDTDHHVIIASGTASGKTEAAFFPILTTLYQKPSDSMGVMYIGPLKALINDQFERLSGLLEESYIPVWPWHGDVSQSVKKHALKEAQGVLQITPESLEALLMQRPGDAVRLFSDLRFVIIDEIHALMGIDRGLQVICLLSRLEKIAGCSPRRMGLSATLNDYQPAMDFLAAGSDRKTVAVGVQTHKRTISLCAESFVLPGDSAQAEAVMRQYNDFLYENCHDKKCLIFTNSRGGAEKVIADMKELAQKKRDQDVFYVHHGSVSASLRHEAEAALRNKTGPTVAAATLTLELGIDIGDLDSTIQVGAPYSCASFVQRLGRSGRRTGKSQMLFVDLHDDSNRNPFDSLPWGLLRAIAVIQLYLEERWVEPFNLKPKPFSLLAHQTLSTLMTYGELSPKKLAKNVLLLPAFRNSISQDEYRQLLHYLLENDYLQRMESGGIIVGLKGERLTNHYSYYAVFQDEQVYHVHSKEGEIGTLDNCPAVDEVFVLAGRTWQVQSVDEDRKIIYVHPVKNNRIPSWSGSGGNIHTKIVLRMRQILQEEALYAYLRPKAVELLEQARCFVKETSLLQNSVIPYAERSFFLCPWVGTKEMQTIKSLLACGLKDILQIYSISGGRHYLQVTSDLPAQQFVEKVKRLEIDIENPDFVLPNGQFPKIDKYDMMVPDALLRKAFLYNELDVPGTIEVLKGLEINAQSFTMNTRQ
ncbi:DEAD/DEAH box helicase [Desulforamulus aeronauticus]|uniref:ATP-dependent helicase Lhr and Lhr-like helicase n=1 Tax=Desulforamulus aeronauticus DSM 10349 TaxID=1121421 RepID=A0A1M6SS92_9FIRM|nr:DEAD/DEAH box helicase [Desulforamulus aeronauticus]SHK47594.1 ATP-dependent helicase Lhr and Lhr-like helicase [Desulforamulus aeronauticus DSM 10349]